MIHHHLTKWKWPFSDSNTTKQPFLTSSTTDNIQCTAGILIKNKELILARWAEYLQNLLSKVHISDPGLLDDLPTLPIIPYLCNQLSYDEVEKAILFLNDNKAADPDNIPARQHSDNIRSTDGVLLKNKELILARLDEYLQNLLNKVHISYTGFLDDLQTLLTIPSSLTWLVFWHCDP